MVFPSETPPKIGTAKDSATPAMRQYLEAKRLHRDAIVFFRMGDFYEMFFEDAVVAARVLDLTLTSRSKDANGGGIPMCGVPHHALDTYLARLVQKGYRVAICDQVEDPRKAKGLVRREVVRVVSPGTLTDANYLDAREPAFLVAVAVPSARGPEPAQPLGVALLDLSTGEFSTTEYPSAAAFNEELRRLDLPERVGQGLRTAVLHAELAG
jgi:DNA mismatch repair protein MutS